MKSNRILASEARDPCRSGMWLRKPMTTTRDVLDPALVPNLPIDRDVDLIREVAADAKGPDVVIQKGGDPREPEQT